MHFAIESLLFDPELELGVPLGPVRSPEVELRGLDSGGHGCGVPSSHGQEEVAWDPVDHSFWAAALSKRFRRRFSFRACFSTVFYEVL